MRRTVLNIGTVLLLAAASSQLGFKTDQQQNNTPLAYTGVVIDSACAQQGSHTPMMEKEGTPTPKDCVLSCIKQGSKLALYNSDAKMSYNLDDQDKTRDHAAEKVTIVGTYDGPTKTIHIQSITVVP